MILMSGICFECSDGKEKRLAKKRPPLCGYHYKLSQQKKSFEKNKDKPRKPIKPLKRTPLSYKKEPTGELELMKKMYESMKEKVSFISGEPIYGFSVSNFSHVLPKAQNRYPLFKLYEPNIKFLTFREHFLWDNGCRDDLKKLPEWNKMFELEEKLKQEYKKLYGK